MKKCLAAVLVLAALLAVSLWNIHHIDALTDGLSAQVTEAQTAWRAGSFDAAARTVNSAIDGWKAADGYTHIFIRHSEIDATADAFYELLETVLDGDAPAADAACGRLLYHLESIRSIEHVDIKSIF